MDCAPGAVNGVPLRAVVPAALTPFDADLAIDRPALRRHLEALAAVPGVTAIMVNGAAGQDAALSRAERRAIVAVAVAAVGSRTPILAALRETAAISLAELAGDAAAAGARALMIMPPPDPSGLAWDGASARFAQVFEAAELPVAIYHVAYDTPTLTRLAQFPRVFAIKEGSASPADFEANLRAVRGLGRDVAIWSTHSRWLLAALAMGADGLLSGMGSITADLHAELAAAVWRSDLAAARAVSKRLFPLTQVFYSPGRDPHARMKYALMRLGRWSHDFVRPPQQPLSAAERARIDAALEASGLLPGTGMI